ncbi:HYD1 signature containing ADP-ribosyltransferase family protein [Bowmanella denitrificans]
MQFSNPMSGLANWLSTPGKVKTMVALMGTVGFLSQASEHSVTLSWNQVDGAEHYRLEERQNGSSGNWTHISPASLLSHTLSKSTGKFDYRVIGCLVDPSRPTQPLCDEVAQYSQTLTIDYDDPATLNWAAFGGEVADQVLPNISPGSSNYFGPLPGKAAVSGGSASYTIPIAIPPGRAGMAPSVALSYSSRAGNGLAGVGWDLSAGGSISRCPATLAQDGFSAGVSYNGNTDRLCLNGQRLVLRSGVYGGSGATYATELDQFLTVKQQGAINSSGTYFTVTYADGRMQKYDAAVTPQGAAAALSWQIGSEHDVSGQNAIHYVYSQDQSAGEILLESIFYTGQGTTIGNRKVEFNYENRSKYSTSYLAGGKTRQTKRLESVKTYYANTLVRSYTLGYEVSRASGRSLLQSVSECAETQCRSTTFDWQDDAPKFQLELFTSSDGTEIYPSHVDRFGDEVVESISSIDASGDVNGDGVRDWKTYSVDNSGQYIGQHQFLNAEGDLLGTSNFAISTCMRSSIDYSDYCIEGDFNLDGRTDTWKIENDQLKIGYVLENQSGIYVDWSTNNQHITIEPYVSLASPGDTLVDANDYNGDGWPDLIVKRKISPNAASLTLYLHSQNLARPYQSGQHLINIGLTQNAQFVGDMNADGLPDLVEYGQGLNQARPVPHRLLLTHVSTQGTVSLVAHNINFTHGGIEGDYAILVDANGDGLKDWLGWMGGAGNLFLKLNQGDGNFAAAVDLGAASVLETRNYPMPSKPGEAKWGLAAKFEQAIKIADIDGDGRSELLIPGDVLVAGCHKIYGVFDHLQGRKTDVIKCGHELYGNYQTSQTGPEQAMFPEWDRSIYRYNVMKFVENTNGTFSATIGDSGLVGAANYTKVVDAFGKGLSDMVFSYGCVQYADDGCSFNGSSNLLSQQNSVYINRNYGATDKAEPGKQDYRAIDLMVAANDSAGNQASWHYRPLSSGNGEFYQRQISDVIDEGHFNFASSMYVVAEFQQSNGVGSNNKQSYQYGGATYNHRGRGFRGFTQITQVDDANGTQTETNFLIKFPFTSQVASQSVYQVGEQNPIQTQTNHWLQNPNYAFTNSWHIYNQQATVTKFDVQSTRPGSVATTTSTSAVTTSTMSVNSIDQYGNVAEQVTLVTDSTMSHTTKVETDYTQATSSWPNRWESRKVTKSVDHLNGLAAASGTNETQVVETQVETWNSTFRQPQVLKVSGDTSTLTSTYVYNDYGLPKTITQTGNVLIGSSATATEQSRITELYYSNDGQSVAADGYFVSQQNQKLGGNKVLATNIATDPTNGLPLTQVAINGVTTTTGYDAFNRPKTLDVTGQPTQYLSYQQVENQGHAVMKVVVQQAGNPTTEQYQDSLGRTVKTRTQGFDGNWISQDISFTARGFKASETTPYTGTDKGTTTYSGYDVLGRLVGKLTSGSHGNLITQYSYQGLTTNISTTADIGHNLSMSRRYNSLQQLVNTVDAKAGSTDYLYDAGGNPILIQDANAVQITAKYDALGRKLWVDDPNQGKTSFVYNDFAELETETDANSKTIYYDMDKAGRVTTRIADGKTALFGWDTCKTGMLCSESENGVNKTYKYNYAALPYQSTLTVDGTSYTTETQYDQNSGKPKALIYPNGLILGYEYNSYGYLTREYNAATDYSYRTVTAQDAFGNITTAQIGDENAALTSSIGYSAISGQMLFNVVKNGNTALHSLNYAEYDSYGNLLEQQNLLPTFNSTETFAYDELQRLVTASTSGNGVNFSVSYGYDAVGNIRHKSDYSVSGDSAYQYVESSNKLESVDLKGGGSETYGYDNKGNLTHRNGIREVTYNVFNKPTQISRNGSVSFVYGADLARVKQVRSAGSGEVTTYYVDKHYEVETSSSGSQQKAYIADIAILTFGSDTSIAFTHRDRLGSATTFTDHNGQVTAYRHFDAFGTPRGGDWSQLSLPRLAEGPSRRGFTDHEHLDEAELIHMNGRVYDYKVGRFLSVDPIIQSPGNSQSINPYSYIMNNPLAGTDPSGYSAVEPEKLRQKVTVTGSKIKRDAPVGGTNTIGGSAVGVSYTGVGGAANGAQNQGNPSSNNQAIVDKLGQGEVAKQGSNAASSNSNAQSNAFDPFAPTPLGNLQNWIFENLINPMPEIKASIDAINEGDFSGAAQSMVGIVGKKVKAVGKLGEKVNDSIEELTERVRHFTNNKGLEGIRESNSIIASDQNSVFTVKARGRVGSARDIEKQLGIKRGKGNNYVEFDANPNEIQVIKNPVTGAAERVFEGDVDLTGRNASFYKNR